MSTHARTEVSRIDPEHPDPYLLRRAGEYIRRGMLVAFPTETVYGLGANALDEIAVRRIFTAKQRDPDDPLIVHVALPGDVDRVAADIPAVARSLIQRFWPGPLTLVLKRRPEVARGVSGGRETVAVRMPDHPVALGVIRAAGVPVAAPSANRFTRTSATTARHVLDDLDGRIELVLDGGPTRHGIESTVVDATSEPLRLLRPGAVTLEALEDATGARLVVESATTNRSSPGMMPRHYAPHTRLRFVESERIADLVAAVAEESATGRKPGVLCLVSELAQFDPAIPVEELGESMEDVARNLFAALRRMDARGVDVIVVRDYGEAGLGRAVRDRLRRASTARE